MTDHTPDIRAAQADLVDALADLLDEYQRNHDIAECAAYCPGETGRQNVIDTWQEIVEEPAEWLRKQAAAHRGNDTDHLQGMLYDAWAAGAEETLDYVSNQHQGIDPPRNPYDPGA